MSLAATDPVGLYPAPYTAKLGMSDLGYIEADQNERRLVWKPLAEIYKTHTDSILFWLFRYRKTMRALHALQISELKCSAIWSHSSFWQNRSCPGLFNRRSRKIPF